MTRKSSRIGRDLNRARAEGRAWVRQVPPHRVPNCWEASHKNHRQPRLVLDGPGMSEACPLRTAGLEHSLARPPVHPSPRTDPWHAPPFPAGESGPPGDSRIQCTGGREPWSRRPPQNPASFIKPADTLNSLQPCCPAYCAAVLSAHTKRTIQLLNKLHYRDGFSVHKK